MAIEIERKFLVHQDKLPDLKNGTAIEQAYVPTSNENTVRVRIAGEMAYLCIKSPTETLARLEYEYTIPVNDARELLNNACDKQRVEKHRYIIKTNGMSWEVDVFHGKNEGLIVAEIELTSEDQLVDLPDWVADEVTYDERYKNIRLAMTPYRKWPSPDSQES